VARLSYVARYFGVVKVNPTFYRPAPERMVDDWLAKAAGAPDFRCTH